MDDAKGYCGFFFIFQEKKCYTMAVDCLGNCVCVCVSD